MDYDKKIASDALAILKRESSERKNFYGALTEIEGVIRAAEQAVGILAEVEKRKHDVEAEASRLKADSVALAASLKSVRAQFDEAKGALLDRMAENKRELDAKDGEIKTKVAKIAELDDIIANRAGYVGKVYADSLVNR